MGELPLVAKFIGLVQNCRKERSLANAKHVLLLIRENGLETHKVLGNFIVPMLVECGSFHEAQDVFRKLVFRNEHSWTSLIQACVEHEKFEQALDLFQQMQEDFIHFSNYTFQAILKACAALKCVERGKEIHGKIIEHGLENDPFLCSSLVDVYAKCFSFEEANQVLFSTQFRDVVPWNALIAGYAENGYGKGALVCLDKLQHEGICPSAVTFSCTLKACGSLGALTTGQELHIEVIKRGFECGYCVDGALMYMYSKCGFLAEAKYILNELNVKNVICWTSLIDGYAEHSFGEEAVSCLRQMQLEGVSPNAMTYVCCLKGCGNLGDTGITQELHMDISKKGYEGDPFISNSLVDVYGKNGYLLEARKVFDNLLLRDLFSWNALISGYTEHGLGHEALFCFNQMHSEGALTNALTFVFTLKACCVIQYLEKGQQLHIEIVKRGLEKEECVENSLVDMYIKCGSFEEGFRVFDEQLIHDVVSWTSLLGGYVEQGLGAEALNCLERMQQEGATPSAITFICCLKACASSGDFVTGCKIHFRLTILGLENDPSVGSCVVDMYAKCGCLVEAKLAFEKLSLRDEHAWNALIVAYGEHGFGEHLSRCLEQMEIDGICPNSAIFASMLRAHDSMGSKDGGYNLYSCIVKKGLEKDLSIASSLVVMSANSFSIVEAEQLFKKLPCRNVVLWTALVTKYVEQGQFEKALNCLERMQLDGVSPNDVTLLCSLKAAGNVSAIGKGQAIHTEMMKKGFQLESIVGNAVVDMYSKCGSLLEAQEQLEKLQVKNVISWTALITGFAYQGDNEHVFWLLERMRDDDVRPDGVTYLSVLIVCSHAGLVIEGIVFFDTITKEDGIALSFEHLSCIVDLVARAGQLDNAVLMLEEMPFQPNRVTWTTMLGACRKWQNLGLGKQAFESLRGLDEKQAAAFLLMLDIYANADM